MRPPNILECKSSHLPFLPSGSLTVGCLLMALFFPGAPLLASSGAPADEASSTLVTPTPSDVGVLAEHAFVSHHASHPRRFFVDTGPMRIRDQFALSMGYLGLDPVGATVLEASEWEVDIVTTISNTWAQSDIVEEALLERTRRQPFGFNELDALAREEPGGGLYFVDTEVNRTALAFRRGIGGGVQLELVLPVIDFRGGFFDGVIEGFHDTFGFGQAGREGVQRNQFQALLRGKSGALYLEEAPGARIGDIVLGAKFRLREPGAERGYRLAVETVVELPTGKSDQLTSNGTFDLGSQVLFTRYYRRACLHVSAGLTYLGEWRELGIGSQILPSFMVAWEQGLSRRTSALIQGTFSETPFDALGLEELSQTSMQLTLGVKRMISNDRILLVGLTENIQNFDNTADLGAHFGVTWRR